MHIRQEKKREKRKEHMYSPAPLTVLWEILFSHLLNLWLQCNVPLTVLRCTRYPYWSHWEFCQQTMHFRGQGGGQGLWPGAHPTAFPKYGSLNCHSSTLLWGNSLPLGALSFKMLSTLCEVLSTFNSHFLQWETRVLRISKEATPCEIMFWVWNTFVKYPI